MSEGSARGRRPRDYPRREPAELRSRIILAVLLAGILAVGTIGYVLIEGWSWLDALYMTSITVSTVGFREVGSTLAGRQIFTILLILCGMSFIVYGIGTMIEFLVGGQLTGVFRRRTVRKQLAELRDTTSSVATGAWGRPWRGSSRDKASFVVVDSITGQYRARGRRRVSGRQGDASDDAVLEEAGITPAQGLVAAVGSDAGQHLRDPFRPRAQPASADRCAGSRTRPSTSCAGGGRPGDLALRHRREEDGHADAHPSGERLPGRGDRRRRDRVPPGGVRPERRCCAIGQSINDLDVRRTDRRHHPGRAQGEHGHLRHQPVTRVRVDRERHDDRHRYTPGRSRSSRGLARRCRQARER